MGQFPHIFITATVSQVTPRALPTTQVVTDSPVVMTFFIKISIFCAKDCPVDHNFGCGLTDPDWDRQPLDLIPSCSPLAIYHFVIML